MADKIRELVSVPPQDESDADTHRTVPFHKSNEVRTAADGHGKQMSDCGDLVEFFIQLEGETVKDVTCRVSGCTNTFASARAAGMIVKGKTVRDAIKAANPCEIDQLAALAEQHRHCAEMAADAMKAALTDAALGAREPWRKLYRKV